MGRRSLAALSLIAGGAALVWWRAARAAQTDPFAAGGGGYLEPASSWPAIDFGSGDNWVEDGLMARGIPYANAHGIGAGVYAESLADPTAVNPTSGAIGIGQWLGSRKVALLARYGPNPSPADQLDFLVWELRGGDHGGAAVLAQTTPAATLDAYIRRFMRPGSGTAGDLARGQRYLG